MHAKLLLFAVTTALSFTACARTPEASAGSSPVGPALAAQSPPDAQAQRAEITRGEAVTGIRMLVHKSESCGCCGLWVDHMRAAGYLVEVRNADDLNPIKERLGVPYGKGSCHTAEVAGYFIEGHVPAADVTRLIEEKPDAAGLVLPGMPMGSPGMESADGSSQPYTVELVRRDGTTAVFAEHPGTP
jgi:hypothetical protein